MITTDIGADVRAAAPAVVHRRAAPPRTTTRPPGTAAQNPAQDPAHDATLAISALEELEAKRRALAWLVEADLLWRCLP